MRFATTGISMFHAEDALLIHLNTIFVPDAWPFKFNAPLIVWVEPAANSRTLLGVMHVKLLNVVLPDICEVPAPLNVTVPPLALNVPEFAQLPATFMLPLVEINVPLARVNPAEPTVMAGLATAPLIVPV